METPSGNGGSNRRQRLIRAGVVVVVLAVCVGATAWFFAPRLTESLLSQQLERVEERTGLAIEADSFQTQGVDGLELRGIELRLPDSDKPLGTIAEIDATADLFQAIRGRPAVTALTIRGVELEIERHADGSSSLDDVLDPFRTETEEDDELPAGDETSPRPEEIFEAISDRLLRHFGGAYPDVLVEDVVVEFTHHRDATPWPVERIGATQFLMEGDAEEAPFSTTIEIAGPGTDDLQLPESIDIAGVMRLPIERSTVAIDLEPELRLANLPRLPFTEFSLTSLRIDDDFTVEFESPRLESRLRGTSEPLAGADRVRLQFHRWTLSPFELRLEDIAIDGPRLVVDYDESGASNLSELYAIAVQPAAGSVAATAHAIGDSIAADRLDDDGAEDDEQGPRGDSDDDRRPPNTVDQVMAVVAELPIRDWLIEYLPRSTTIRDLRLVVTDARAHEDLIRPAAEFELAGDILELHHSALQGVLQGNFQFEIITDDDVASTDIQFHLPYRSGDWNASVDINGIELAHFAQLGGPRVARHLHGGRVTATFDVDNESEQEGTMTRFDGMVAADDLRVHFTAIAEEPIALFPSSLQMKGFYHPSMPVPAPELINRGHSVLDAQDSEELDSDEDGDNSDEQPGDNAPQDSDDEERIDAPQEGAFVIEEAVGRVGDLKANLNFGLYGIDGFNRPNRVTVGVDLERTPLQTIIDAVPAALRGPLDGLEMIGELSWSYHLEVPLYEASKMVWDADVELSEEIEVVNIPAEVDVFKLTDEFEHTIEDEWEETIVYRDREVFYSRTVTIPEMRPTPAHWFLANTSHDLERLDNIRREREWPEVAEWNPSLDMDREELESPEYWLTEIALADTAEVPWDDTPADEPTSFWDDWGPAGDVEEADDDMIYEEVDPPEPHELEIFVDADRHGPYVYVPLHHISPYMPRAIMTTEDTSFFTHNGFNLLAIRHSVEANLEAGRYVRGGSTISMQLAKNLFLDRSRVLSRKLQEVALVWLMESVADIPKARMMELYLNIIEFGPGIYGINEAAVYYFGKRPDELTIAEVSWLVSIVPNPKRYHTYYERGEITDYWFRRMSRYILAMYNRERISEEERDAAQEEKPSFYIPEDGESLLRELTDDERDQIEPDETIETIESDEEPDSLDRFNLPGF